MRAGATYCGIRARRRASLEKEYDARNAARPTGIGGVDIRRSPPRVVVPFVCLSFSFRVSCDFPPAARSRAKKRFCFNRLRIIVFTVKFNPSRHEQYGFTDFRSTSTRLLYVIREQVRKTTPSGTPAAYHRLGCRDYATRARTYTRFLKHFV